MDSSNIIVEWMDRLGFSKENAADHLGITEYDIALYSIGEEQVPRAILENMNKIERMTMDLKRQRKGK